MTVLGVALLALLLPLAASGGVSLQVSAPTVQVGSFPESFALAPDGSRLYVVNSNPVAVRQASLSVIDTASRVVVATYGLGSGYSAEQIAPTPDGTRAYVANATHVDVVNLATGKCRHHRYDFQLRVVD